MKDNFVLGIAVVALLLSLVAITSAFVITPEMTIQDSSIDTSKLAEDSVTSEIIIDDTITDEDIADNSISSSHIIDGAITISDLHSDVIEVMSGETEMILDIPDNSITSEKIVDGEVKSEDIAEDAIGSSEIISNSIGIEELKDDSVGTDNLLDNSITSEKIIDETITEDDIKDYEKIISFPALSLNYHEGSDLTTGGIWGGLKWEATYSEAAYLILERPNDWDGETGITMHIHFISGETDTGNVQFFIRPRAFNFGEYYTDANSITGKAVSVTGINRIYEQSIIIPASKFGTKDLWVITIQRGGASETYSDYVHLLGVSLIYNAIR